jgi:hypothetical protein
MATTHTTGLSSPSADSTPQILNRTHRRWLAGVFLLLTASAGAFVLWLSVQGCGDYLGVTPFMAAVNVASSLAFAVLSVLILLYRPGNRIGWLCGWVALGGALTVMGYVGIPCGVAASPPLPGLPILAWAHYSFSAFFTIMPLFILLPLLFPNGRFLSKRWAWATWIGVVLFILINLAMSLTPDLRYDNGGGFLVEMEAAWLLLIKLSR